MISRVALGHIVQLAMLRNLNLGSGVWSVNVELSLWLH